MRSLKNKPQVNPPSSTYPHGQIRDDNGSGNFGTPVNEQVYGDFHQFFSQLMIDGGLIPNEIAENEYNGFQLNTALGNFINKLAEQLIDDQGGSWIDITLINGWTTYLSSTPNTPQYRVTRSGKVEFRGIIDGGSATNSKAFNAISYLVPKGKGGTSPSGVFFALPAAGGDVAHTAVIDPGGFLLIAFFGGGAGINVFDLTPINYYNR